MKAICSHNNCTGCGLCVAQCPKGCISMVPGNNFGHLFPKINEANCIDCGLCKKICPSLHHVEKSYPNISYAAWSKDEEDYKSSTSGGAASVLSQYVLSHGGVVYGCSMFADIDVRHIRIDNIDDLCKLKGSKYVQSDVTSIYPQLRDDVREGRLTLFTGTPCQVAAVKNMFKKQPENLILVDLICHGVPSLHMLKQHVKGVANYPHYDKVIFREGNIYEIVVIVEGEKVYRRCLNYPRYNDFYLDTFYDGYTFRESCYSCKYACLNRVSDVTIGDFWKLGKRIPADYIPEHPYGCSLILPSTENGRRLIEKVSAKLNLYERTVEEAVGGNEQLRHPISIDWRKRMFVILYPVTGSSAYRIAVMDKYILFILKRIIKKIIKR